MLSAAAGWGGESGRPHLGRAFSVCRARDGRLEFLLEAIGPGTERLGRARGGRRTVAGRPARHRVRAARRRAAGRCSWAAASAIAPLVIWEEALREHADPARCSGFRNGSYAEAARLLPRRRRGRHRRRHRSGRHHGLVTDLLEQRAGRLGDDVYACGPPPMLEAVRRICVARGVEAQLALEAGMACGFGACFGCVVRDPHRLPAAVRGRAGGDGRGAGGGLALNAGVTAPPAGGPRVDLAGARARPSGPERLRARSTRSRPCGPSGTSSASASPSRPSSRRRSRSLPGAATPRRACGRPRPG